MKNVMCLQSGYQFYASDPGKNVSGVSCRNHSQGSPNEVSKRPNTYFTSNRAQSGGRNSSAQTMVQGSGSYLPWTICRSDAVCDKYFKAAPKRSKHVNHQSENLFLQKIPSFNNIILTKIDWSCGTPQTLLMCRG